MKAFLIIAIILLAIILLLNIPVKFFVRYNGSEFDWSLRFMSFTILPRQKKAKKTRKVKKSSSIAQGKSNSPDGDKFNSERQKESDSSDSSLPPDASKKYSQKKSLKAKKRKQKRAMKDPLPLGSFPEIIGSLKEVLELCGKNIRKILKKIVIDDVDLNFLICDDDAFNAAIKYGAFNAFFWSLLGNISLIFTVKIKNINVQCGFGQSENKVDGSFTLKLRPASAIFAGSILAVKLLYHYKIKEKLCLIKNKIFGNRKECVS